MYDVTVTWTDGKVESFRQVPSFESGDHWLHLFYEEETYSVPLFNVRIWKAEKS